MIRNRTRTTWAAVAKVDFTGWDACPATRGNGIGVTIDDTTSANSGGLGVGVLNMNLGSKRTTAPTDDFTGSLAPHEFGHALGFTHEMARNDFPDSGGLCNEANVSGDYLNTPPDQSSIMASTSYCHNNPNITLWDVVGAQTAYGKRLNGFSVLVNAWHEGRGDNAAVATTASIDAVRNASPPYQFAYAEGWLFGFQAPGTVPLKVFWNASRQDHFTTTNQGAPPPGYVEVRTEGYVYPTQQAGTVPLKLFWSAERGDNFTTTTIQGAPPPGYVEVRTEGYVFNSRPYNLLWLYWSNASTDNLTTAENSSLAADADNSGYALTPFSDGAVLRDQLPGTVPVKTYWSAARTEHMLVSTSAGESSAIQAGYSLLRTEGYVFSGNQTGLVPLKLYWSQSRLDNMSTSTGNPTNQGYSFVRNEGYVLPLN